jgi:hypothetical protein
LIRFFVGQFVDIHMKQAEWAQFLGKLTHNDFFYCSTDETLNAE